MLNHSSSCQDDSTAWRGFGGHRQPWVGQRRPLLPPIPPRRRRHISWALKSKEELIRDKAGKESQAESPAGAGA